MKFLLFLLSCFPILNYAQVNNIPIKAFEYKETIKKEIDTYFNYIPEYNYIPSLIEHESCITLKHSRCWSATSRLLSAREEGAGFFQLTRAFKEDGSVRFDTVQELRNKYKSELKDLKWETIYSSPNLQIRAGILLVKDIYNKLYNINNNIIRLHMTDASYNGGLGGLLKERRACGMSSSCNPNIWFNNVENFCLKSKKVLYGTRNACDINRHHVKDVFLNKLPKYKKHYFKEEI